MGESEAAITIQGFFRRHLLEKQMVLHQAISKSPNVSLLHMMNLRFQCMRAVAAAKLPLKKPIEDKEQEVRIIAGVKRLATDSGIIDLDTIDRIFQHYFELSKAIQRPYYGLIWDKAPRDTQTLVSNAYIQLRNLVSQAGFVHIIYCQEERPFQCAEVLVLARDIIQQVNQEIINILSNNEKHKLNEVTKEAMAEVIRIMLANYMTPNELKSGMKTIQSLASELNGFSLSRC